jgi:hypothetical protein
MTNVSSIVDYIHELKEAGFTDKQAEVQAKRLEQVVAEVKSELKQELQVNELVTKKDLNLAIEKIRYETLKFTAWTGVAVVVTVGGMLAKGFHWI